jgi:hypothetical protein
LTTSKGEPLIAYSLTPSIALDLFVAALFFAAGTYSVVQGAIPIAWFPGTLGLSDAYFRLWRRSVRQARFYDDHVEVRGFGLDIRGGYELVEDIAKYRQNFGDFRSNSRVSFSFRGDPNVFVFPNRKNRNLGIDVYSLLMKKTASGALQTGSR